MGPATAKYLLFSGELIDAERALRTGLVDEVLPVGELDKRVAEFTRVLASRSRLTQAAAKEFANGRTDRDAYWAEQARAAARPPRASPRSWSAVPPASPGPARVAYATMNRLRERSRSTTCAGALCGAPAS